VAEDSQSEGSGTKKHQDLEFQEPLGPFLPGLWPSHTSDLSLSLRLGSLVCQSQGVVADTSVEGSPLLLSLHRGTLPSSPPRVHSGAEGGLSWAPKEKSSKKNMLEVSGEGGQERGAY
jgi:hypothetical protein